jgi:regulator of sirC expression with transglutaminase-like and TPR domain
VELAAEVTASDIRRPEAEAIEEEARAQLQLAADYRQAQEAISGGNWASAVALLKAIQSISAGYRDIDELMQKASAGLEEERRAAERQRKAEDRVKVLLAAAAMAGSQGDWTQAVAGLEEASQLQPVDSALQSKLSEARKQLQISQLREQAEKAMAAKSWNEAMLSWDRLLKINPLDERAKESLRLAEEARDQEIRQAEVAEWVRQAEIHERARQWTAALAAWNQAITLSPEDAELLRRRDDIVRQQHEEDRNAELEALTEQAAHRETSGDWVGAHAAWTAALRLAPDDPQLQRRLSQAQRKREAGELLASGKDALGRGDWAAALAVTSRLLTDDPASPEAAALHEQAEREKRRHQQYQAAEQLEARADWSAAAKAWGEVERQSPGYRDVRSRLENARAQESRQADKMRRLAQLTTAASVAEREGRWQDAYAAWSAALALSPNDAQLAARRLQARAARDAQAAQQAAAVAASSAASTAGPKKPAEQTQILPKEKQATSPLPARDGASPAGTAIPSAPKPAAAPTATPIWRRPALLIPVALLLLILCIAVPAVAIRGLVLPGDPTPTLTPGPPATAPAGQEATDPAKAVETAGPPSPTSTLAPQATETSNPTATLEPTIEPSATPDKPTETATALSPTATAPPPTATNPRPTATSPPTATALPPTATAAPPTATIPPPPTETSAPPPATSTAPPPPATATAPPPPATSTAPPPPP